ncbi:MAG: O-acetyl-ADP-ribose deacetylase [Deltaproteobacteria bacterium]|nr:O-acetyl-ADP-ribose deacetylase [Deltaproteobacteria bacterium]
MSLIVDTSPVEKKIGGAKVRLVKDDISAMDIEAFVYYATSDLKLGSGHGNAISMRGGPSIQKELDQIGVLGATEAVVTGAGELKAQYIIHAVGPKFQEEDMERKLETTVLNSLKKADEKGIKALAFPPMGAGFYGIGLDVTAEVMLTTIEGYLKEGNTGLKEVVICANDSRDFVPFRKRMEELR